MKNNRRQFIQSASVAATMLSLPLGMATACHTKTKAKVIVIGGGYAGAAAARYLALWAPDIDITLIEKNNQFISCPQSNLVLSGSRSLDQLTRSYDSLAAHRSIHFIQAEVAAIDTEKKRVRLKDKSQLDYDRLIIAPGIEFIYDELPMLASSLAQQKVPHAWKAGPQTTILKLQLESMPEGGKVVMTVPAAPYRCPPGPYERACQIALHLKRHNPRGKLIIFDANPDVVSKKALFTEAWQQQYEGLIEFIPTSAVETVNVENKTLETSFDRVQADVLNVIPPQRAGQVAQMAGVINVDKRWCDVNYLTYESTSKPHVHVIGDAVAAKTPKSGHIANQQAKVCAAAVIDLINQRQPEQMPVFSNTCYSFVDDYRAGHVAAVYRYEAIKREMVTMDGGGVSATASKQEGLHAEAWAQNIWSDMLG